MAHNEIEMKYLIAMPDAAFLSAQPGCEIWQIEQIYLTAEPGTTRRIRMVSEGGETRYYKTFKRRISAMTAEEDEGLITAEEYEAFRAERNPELAAILKTRYRVPYAGQVLEFDVYPFWTDRAVMEIELESEAQTPVIPDWVNVLRDVTADFRYKNVALARAVPMDEI
jgi:CYTH domain-containing protein